MNYEKTKGIVLDSVVVRESDKSLIIYTERFGKISAVAPGAIKSTAKLLYSTEPLSESELIVYVIKNYSHVKVTSAALINNFSEIRKNCERTIKAFYCLKLYAKLTPFYDTNIKKYNLLKRTLELLEYARNPSNIVLGCTLRFLRYSGYDFLRYHDDTVREKTEKNHIHHFSTFSGEELDSYQLSVMSEKKIKDGLDRYINSIAEGIY